MGEGEAVRCVTVRDGFFEEGGDDGGVPRGALEIMYEY